MPQININVTDQFRSFTNFARQLCEEGQGAKVTRLTTDSEGLAVRSFAAATNDKAGKWGRRLQSVKDENDAVRTLFKETITEMFGGDSKIPASVRKAMNLGDYGKGKPLTARRIMAVSRAIEALDTYNAGAIGQKFMAAYRATMAGKGFFPSEFKKIARAADFYQKATGCNDADALNAVTDPKNAASRLMKYGGRFMANAENFADGLKLIDSFKGWYDETRAGFESKATNNPTLINGDKSQFGKDSILGFEKFIFEEIASNPAMSLKTKTPEEAFGMKNNAATRFIGRTYASDRALTLAQIPPEKRSLLYAVIDVLDPIQQKAGHKTTGLSASSALIYSRVMRNLDAIAAMQKAGKLTRANILTTFFSDLGITAKMNNTQFYDTFTAKGTEALIKKFGKKGYGEQMGPLFQGLESSGLSLDEVFQSLFEEGKQPPTAPYIAASDGSLKYISDTCERQRNQFMLDAGRATNYSKEPGGRSVLAPEDLCFSIKIGNASPLKTKNGTDEKAKRTNENIMKRVEAFCGPAHNEQRAGVLLALTQGGLAPLNRGLLSHGYGSTEHTAVKMELTRNEDNGAITIKYSQPNGFPPDLKFSWTVTVDLDGKITSTPLEVTKR